MGESILWKIAHGENLYKKNSPQRTNKILLLLLETVQGLFFFRLHKFKISDFTFDYFISVSIEFGWRCGKKNSRFMFSGFSEKVLGAPCPSGCFIHSAIPIIENLLYKKIFPRFKADTIIDLCANW